MSKKKIVSCTFTEDDFLNLNEHQKEYLIENYKIAEEILLKTKANKEWRFAKRKSIQDINNEPNFYLVGRDNPLTTLHIFADETFIDSDSQNLVFSSETIEMIYYMKNYLRFKKLDFKSSNLQIMN